MSALSPFQQGIQLLSENEPERAREVLLAVRNEGGPDAPGEVLRVDDVDVHRDLDPLVGDLTEVPELRALPGHGLLRHGEERVRRRRVEVGEVQSDAVVEQRRVEPGRNVRHAEQRVLHRQLTKVSWKGLLQEASEVERAAERFVGRPHRQKAVPVDHFEPRADPIRGDLLHLWDEEAWVVITHE